MKETIRFFSPTKSIAPALGLMARQAFSDAFAHLYDPVPFQQFLDTAYGPAGKMDRDFADPSIQWRVAANRLRKALSVGSPCTGAATRGDGVAADLRPQPVAR
jgi:hypothetical protein